MKESMPSSAQPPQAAKNPRIWLRVRGVVGVGTFGMESFCADEEYSGELAEVDYGFGEGSCGDGRV